MERKLRTAEIVVKGKVLHIVYGYRNFRELYFGEFFADNYDRIEFEDILDGTDDFDDRQWYHFIDGWLYGTQLFGGEIVRMNGLLVEPWRAIDASMIHRSVVCPSFDDNFNFE